MESRRKILVRYRRGDKIRAISRDLNISRNTVRKIIYSEDQAKSEYIRIIQPSPKLGKHIELLERLLRDNKNVRPKRTGKALFEELKNNGYQGSYSAVSRYISLWEERTSVVGVNACIPLYFAPGEAYQFDWSTDYIILNGEMTTVKVAHFVLCYSRKKFVYIYPNETQEMVFDSHVRAFKFFGGTPTRGIYDNMKTAIKKVLRGSGREWNPNFEKLCVHYLIEPTACTPGRGNEKGQVERQVQIDREQFLTPMPKGSSLEELNDLLMSQLIQYNKTHKHPKYPDKTLDDIFEEERNFLVSAPVLFEGCKEIDVRVSLTCLVRYDRNNYSVHCSCAGKVIQCKAYADKVIFVHNGTIVGNHRRKFTRGETSYDYQHYLPVLAKKPGALRNGAPFIDIDLPEELQKVRQHLEKYPNGTRDFAHILSYIPIESMESVVAACQEAITNGNISKDVIINILLRKKEQQTVNEEIVTISYPTLRTIVETDYSPYS